MAIYEAGERIREIRESCGITQEELAYGICSTGTLSKIENGVQAPNKRTFEALMQRLGEPEYFYSIHLSRKEMQCMKIGRKLKRSIRKGNLIEAEKLWQQYHPLFDEAKVLEQQSYRAMQAFWHAKKGMIPCRVIGELEDALKLTLKWYKGELPGKKQRLTFEEISIFNNIAVQYQRMGESEKAFSYFKWLKEYFEIKECDEEEMVEIYPMLLCNYAEMLKAQELYEKAESVAEMGIRFCMEYDGILALPYLMGSMARSLTERSRLEEAEKYFKQAECLLCIMGYGISLDYLRENSGEKLELLL